MIEVINCVVPAAVTDRWSLDRKKLADFERTTGILKTRKASCGSVAMAVRAAKTALEFTDVNKIRCLIVVTQTPDRLSPPMAVSLLEKLNLPGKHIPAFDVNQACSGYVYGLHIANAMLMMEGDPTARALVVTVDRLQLEGSDTEKLIFSDAATATVMSFSRHFHATFYNDPRGQDHLYMLRSGKMHMNGNRVFEYVTENVPKMIEAMPPADLLVQHQANILMMKLVAKKSGYEGRSLESLAEYGNASMNSIPLAICHNRDLFEDEAKSVLMAGYGAGWSVALGSTVITTQCVKNVIQV